MPPKPSVKRTQSRLEKDEQAQYALQGIVLCDVATNLPTLAQSSLHPILVPLAGTPLLEYTLEFLERGGIQNIILVTSTLPSQLRGYLSSSRWGQRDYPVRVKVVGMAVVGSVGDALREIDRQGLVKSDFVLLRGGLLTNLHLPFVVEEHRRIQALEKDKLLMTMVNSQGKSINNAFDSHRNLRDACLHVLDENQNASESTNYDFQQCLLLEHLEVYPDRKRVVHLSKEISSIHKDVTFRNDLSDCYIDICTPEVPALFTENFDYEDLRKDLVNGVLTSDILSKTIYCYIVKEGYCSTVTNYENYWTASNDITRGVTAPFDPSMNLQNDQTFVKRGDNWREREVKVDKSAQVKESVIGAGSVISEGATVVNSVVGRKCVISPRAVVRDSVLWDNVIVGQGVHILHSIVEMDTHVPAGSHLSRGIVLPSKTILPPNTTIQGTDTFTVYATDGPPIPFSEDSDNEDESFQIDTLNLTDSEISEIGSDSDSDSETRLRRRRSSASGNSDILTHEEFFTEANESLVRAFTENHSLDNATIELKTLRMATNVTSHEIRQAIITALLNICITDPTHAPRIVTKWAALFDRFREDGDVQMEILWGLQRGFVTRLREGVPVARFVRVLQVFYEGDVVEEEKIIRWFEDERARGSGERWGKEMMMVRESAEKFVTWLKEAEEESDE